MIPRSFSTIFVITFLLSQLSIPAVSCLGNCHSQVEGCHRTSKIRAESSGCSHTRSASAVQMTAAASCDCTIQANRSTPSESQFALDSARTKTSKLSVSDTLPLSSIPFVLLEARLHGPPFPMTPNGQAFLLNSSLRI